jgi:hypothetical protein
MDPDACLDELLTLAREALSGTRRQPAEDSERMAELALALDEWVQRGGFLPRRWVRQDLSQGGA